MISACTFSGYRAASEQHIRLNQGMTVHVQHFLMQASCIAMTRCLTACTPLRWRRVVFGKLLIAWIHPVHARNHTAYRKTPPCSIDRSCKAGLQPASSVSFISRQSLLIIRWRANERMQVSQCGSLSHGLRSRLNKRRCQELSISQGVCSGTLRITRANSPDQARQILVVDTARYQWTSAI